MIVIKKFISKNFKSFAFFYIHLRYRVAIVLLLSILLGFMDGIGLSMFLPLLQVVSDNPAQGEDMGKLNIIVDLITGMGFGMTLGVILFFLLVFFVLKGIVGFFAGAYLVNVQQYFISKVRFELLDLLNQMDYKEFIKADVGRIQNTFTLEVNRVYRGFKNYFTALQQVVLVVVYSLFAFMVDPQFALLVSIGGGVTSVIYKYIYKLTRSASSDVSTGSHFYQGQIIQHITNYKYLKATAFLDSFGAKLKKTIKSIEMSNRKVDMLGAFVTAIREPILVSIVVGVIYYQVEIQAKSLAPIMVSLLFFYRALGALMNVQNSWNSFLSMYGSVENVSSFQKELQGKKEKKTGGEKHELIDSILFRDVDFSFGERKILNRINFEIHNRSLVAIMGTSGSGKTTLVNLIAGLLKPEAGDILIDGKPMRMIDTDHFQSKIGYITQEPVIFTDTVFNNVTLWAERTEENINRFNDVMKLSKAAEFVNTLDNGIDTYLTNNGTNLSGGQRQRLSIARELFKKPGILIFDEGTSALDIHVKQAIISLFPVLKEKYLVLVISHDDLNLSNFDKIIQL